jgi:hypothetical protein
LSNRKPLAVARLQRITTTTKKNPPGDEPSGFNFGRARPARWLTERDTRSEAGLEALPRDTDGKIRPFQWSATGFMYGSHWTATTTHRRRLACPPMCAFCPNKNHFSKRSLLLNTI